MTHEIEKSEGIKNAVLAGHAITMIENDTQKQIAVQNPRNEKKILADSLAELEMDRQVAEKAFYSIPYKDYNNTDRGGAPKITYVQGISIQGAMALARRWGNCANAWRVSADTDQYSDKIKVEGVFLDYETNVRTVRTVTVPATYFSKTTKKEMPLNSQRLTMAIGAGGSKAVRNAILASLPEYLKNQYFKRSGEIASGKMQGDTRPQVERIKEEYEKLKPILKEFGILPKDMPVLLGKASIKSDEDIVKLRGICNALSDGVTTREELLGASQKKSEPAKQGAVDIDTLLEQDIAKKKNEVKDEDLI